MSFGDHPFSTDLYLFNEMEDGQNSLASCDSTLSTADSNNDFSSYKPNHLLLPFDSSIGNHHFSRETTPKHESDYQYEYDFFKPRRASSLKTARTQPGETQRSKIVRFADVLGLDLEDVRHIFNQDQPPKIPASAVKDLKITSSLGEISSQDNFMIRYEAQFTQPGAAPDFLRQIRISNVGLENAFIENNILSGTIRVMNITFDKKVSVRVSFNNWTSFIDCTANYVFDSHDGVTDRFSFSLLLPPFLSISTSLSSTNNQQKIELAIRYECSNGSVFWDNFGGKNYCFLPTNSFNNLKNLYG